jgi:anti-sigma factor RsiW
MTCGELIEFLMAYVDEELPAERRAVFDAHLAVCAACRRYLATYQEAVALGRAACSPPDAPVADDVPEDLVQAILAARGGRAS